MYLVQRSGNAACKNVTFFPPRLHHQTKNSNQCNVIEPGTRLQGSFGQAFLSSEASTVLLSFRVEKEIIVES